MLSVIKTAIITITISFISGVLLDTYKNLAPKILCTMGTAIPIKLNNKRIKAYILKVKNTSKKTLHNLTVNVQGHGSQGNLKIDDAKITGGLKFDVTSEYNNFNVSIPFLSRNDEFSVKVFVDNMQYSDLKPIVTLRSPENFREVVPDEKNGFLSSLISIPESICKLFFKKANNNRRSGIDNIERHSTERHFINKRVLITTASMIIIISIGFLGAEYYSKIHLDVKEPDAQSNIQHNSDTSSISSSQSSKNSSSKASDTSANSVTSNTKASSEEDNDSSGEKYSSSLNDKNEKTSFDKSEKIKTSSDADNKNTDVSEDESTSGTDKNNQTSNTKSQNNASLQNNTSSQNNNSSDIKSEGTDKQSADENTNKNKTTQTSPAEEPKAQIQPKTSESKPSSQSESGPAGPVNTPASSSSPSGS